MSLKKNVIANYLGQGWSALMGIAFIPLYIKYLGLEAYGLIGVFAIMQAWLTLLDMGMTPTLSREMVRYKAGAYRVESILDLLRSIEWICAALALLIVSGIWLAAPLISSQWLKVEKLPMETVNHAIVVMGFVMSTRLWEEVYRGAIRGMQQQVWLNITQATLTTLRWVGVLAVLAWISPTVQAFFLWQGLTSVISVIIYASKTYLWLPSSQRRGKFSLDAIKGVGRFAGGIATITLLALLLTQVDKVLLSGLLSLEQFGYYTLASVVAGGLAQFITPMNAAIYPRFTELVTKHDSVALIKTYHDSCQLMSAVIVPPALVLAAFAKPVLLLWTGDHTLTNAASPILNLLVMGTLFNGFMNVPYMLQLAHGWTGFAVRTNVVAVAIIIPAILWAVPRYGAIGAAWIWVALNASYVLIGIHFMYYRLIPDQKWRWYRESVARPLIAGSIVAFGLAFILPVSQKRLDCIFTLLLASICVAASVAIVMPSLRQRIIYYTKEFLYG
ncbi:MAG: oligosaccharide flippase family protein [Methylococcaceae bacterium]|nr:oligosaccharide flippase family protein [Methylococcaceae bacterium]